MPDSTPRPVTDKEVVETLAFGLRCEGRRMRDVDDAMARITAVRLVRLLRASGHQMSKAGSAAVPSTAEHTTPDSPRLKP